MTWDRDDDLSEALRFDTPGYARRFLKIVDKSMRLVMLEPTDWQLRFDKVLEAQRLGGEPQRVIVLKSRKLGFSTWIQAKLVQRVTQMSYRKALVIAHDMGTAAELFDIGRRMYRNLPDDPLLKPKQTAYRKSRGASNFIEFANESIYEVDTANEVEAGRGYTFSDVHISEPAFYKDPRKLTALLNAIPDDPGTLVVFESTANGHNDFKSRWDRAMRGEGDYAPFFAAWWEDDYYSKEFASEEHRERFIATIGEGVYAEDEHRLIEQFACTPEQLSWRRNTIVDKCEGKVEKFKQEYPASPEEAFVASGKHVFSMIWIQRALDSATEAQAQGTLQASGSKVRATPGGPVEVPTGTAWWPREATNLGVTHPYWWRFDDWGVDEAGNARLKPPGDRQYVIAVDVAGGEEITSTGDLAFHAIQVVDHATLEQVAEYRSRIDTDLLAVEAFLIGHLYNEAWLAVETTGGWGSPVARRLWHTLGYRRLYFRTPAESVRLKQSDRLGFSTDRATKPRIEAGMAELLREQNHGIRSKRLALELTTYVRNEKGKSGPDTDSYSDLLMAYMIAQDVAREKPLKSPPSPSRPFVPRDPRTGY